MKKIAAITLLAASSILSTQLAQADTLGLKAGVDLWNANPSSASVSNDGANASPDYGTHLRPGLYVAFEHPAPLIPNVMLRYQDVDAKGSGVTSDQEMYDGVLYYQLFDNPLFGIDYGVNVKYFKGTVSGVGSRQDYSKTIPTGYLAGNVNLPSTGLEVFGNTSMMKFNSNRVVDTQVGLSYDLASIVMTDIQLRAGYRVLNTKLHDVSGGMNVSQNTRGWFMGVGLHF